MQRVQDQHMIGLLARTDGANRTILVNMMKPGLLKAPILVGCWLKRAGNFDTKLIRSPQFSNWERLAEVSRQRW